MIKIKGTLGVYLLYYYYRILMPQSHLNRTNRIRRIFHVKNFLIPFFYGLFEVFGILCSNVNATSHLSVPTIIRSNKNQNLSWQALISDLQAIKKMSLSKTNYIPYALRIKKIILRLVMNYIPLIDPWNIEYFVC